MATRDLISLIKDSGYAASAGQNFDANVPSSDPNIGMADYILTDWSWASSDYSSASNYAYDTVLHFAFSFVSGDHFTYIKRPFSEITVAVDVPSDPGSYGTVTIVDGGYGYNPWGIARDNGIAVRIRGAPTYRTIASWTPDFGYQDSAQEFTDPSFPVDMYCSFAPSFNSASSSYHTFPIGFSYPPTNFNDGLSYSPGNVTVAGPVYNNSYEIEWYDDENLTNQVLAGDTYMPIYGVSNSTQDYGQFWIRYREANGLWSVYNLRWWDRRTYNAYPG